MSNGNNSRRAFFKKVAVVAGVVAAADVTSKLIFGISDKPGTGNNRNIRDAISQQRLMSHKQFVLMTNNEKEQRLNYILNNYYKNIA